MIHTKEKRAMNFKGIRFFILLIMVTMICLYAVTNNLLLIIIGLFLLAFLLATGTLYDDFLLMLTWSVCAPLVTIYGANVFFAFAMIATAKLIINNRDTSIPTGILYSGIVLLMLEFIGDFRKISVGSFLYIISMLIFFVFFIFLFDFSKIEVSEMCKTIIMTMLVAIIATFYASNGDVEYYIYSIDNNVRFGETARSLGGSMGVPIYCLLIISLILALAINKKIKYKLFAYCICFAVFIVGFLSVSRVYLLGLIVLLACLLLSSLKRNVNRSLWLLPIICVVAYILNVRNYDFVEAVIDRFSRRSIGSDFSSGRLDVYADCLRYLLKTPSALFLGSGTGNYVQIGRDEGYLFSMMAHNIFLDLLMSWGLIGLIAMIGLVYGLVKKCKKTFNSKPTFISLMPTIVLASCLMTAGSFNYFNTYVYIIICTIFAYAMGSKQNEYAI